MAVVLLLHRLLYNENSIFVPVIWKKAMNAPHYLCLLPSWQSFTSYVLQTSLIVFFTNVIFVFCDITQQIKMELNFFRTTKKCALLYLKSSIFFFFYNICYHDKWMLKFVLQIVLMKSNETILHYHEKIQQQMQTPLEN